MKPKKSIFIRKTRPLKTILDEYLTSNDDSVLFANLDKGAKIVKIFAKMLQDSSKLNLTHEEQENVHQIFNLYFFDILSVIGGFSINFSGTQTYLIIKLSEVQPDFMDLILKYVKINSNEMIKSIFDYLNLWLKCYKWKEDKEEQSISLIQYLKNYYISGIQKWNEFQCYLIFVCFLSLNLYDQIKLLDKGICDKVTIYIKKLSNPKWSPFIRIMEHFIIKKIKLFNDKYDWYHYTKFENLKSIIQNNEIKFSKLKNTNDLDENILLKNEEFPEDIYSLSFTESADDLGLFKQYTNNEGISIGFNGLQIAQSFKHIRLKDERGYGFQPFEYGRIIYSNDFEKEYDSLNESAINFFSEILEKGLVLSYVNEVKSLFSPFFKKKPWSYEKEQRIIFQKHFRFDESDCKNAAFKNNALFLKVDAKNIIKKIVFGPKIKKNEIKKQKIIQFLEENNMSNIEIFETTSNLNPKKFMK